MNFQSGKFYLRVRGKFSALWRYGAGKAARLNFGNCTNVQFRKWKIRRACALKILRLRMFSDPCGPENCARVQFPEWKILTVENGEIYI